MTDRRGDLVVWSDRIDELGSDLFEIQDRCVTRIAGAVRIRIPRLLNSKSANKPLQGMSDEELLNHAMNHHFTPTCESWELAAQALQQVLRRDPDNWMAMTMLCFNILAKSRIFGWRQAKKANVAMARQLIERAQIIKPQHEVVRMVHGALYFYVLNNHAAARIEAEESLKLNPDYYHSINLMSQIEVFAGDHQKAMVLALRAMDCDPGYPYQHLYQRGAGYVYTVRGKFGGAVDRFQRADQAAPGMPQNLVGIVASATLHGDTDTAQKSLKSLLELSPDFNLAEYEPWPFQDPAKWAPIYNALAASGAPLSPA
ncbi:MAG: hypothetical protein GY952_05955 [Rhodobacteraceae bacterium]|nr:hypothetical protein [Paracoccaceae bacterium]